VKELSRRRFAVRLNPRRPGVWLLAVALVAGVVILVHGMWPGVQRWPIAVVMAVILSVPLAALWLFALRLPQLWARIARSGAASAMLWGAFVATCVYAINANGAIITLVGQNVGVHFAIDWGAAIAAPLTEETGKAFGIIAVLLASGQRLRTPMDGALLGGLVGLGFTVTEDILYSVNIAQLNLGENQWLSTVAIYFLRAGLFGLVSHVLMSAAVGAGLGYLMSGKVATGPGGVPVRLRRPLLGISLIGLGYLLHFTWNSPIEIGPRFVYQAIVPLLAWWVLWGIRRAEARWFRATLMAPGALDDLPPEWIDAVKHSWFARRRYRAGIVRTYGPVAGTLQRQLEASLSDLADAVNSGDQADAERLRAQLRAQSGLDATRPPDTMAT